MKTKLMMAVLMAAGFVAFISLSPNMNPIEEAHASDAAADLCVPVLLPAAECDICVQQYDGCGVPPGTVVNGLNGQPANYVLIEGVTSATDLWCYPNRSFLAECCGCE